MSLDTAILGFLAERPHTGYDLKTRCFTGPLGAFWTADQAQIYRTLDRLKDLGLVTAKRRRQSARPDRKLFEVTSLGRETLAQGIASASPLPPLREPFLIQLYFGAGLDDEALAALLVSRRREYQARLEDVRARSTALAEDHELSPRDAVLKQTALDGAMASYRATVDWLDDCIEAVEQGALPGSVGGIGQRQLFGS